MKKTMIITGFVSVIAFVLGSFFKVMHWPGAGVLFVLGLGSLSVIFLPLLFILKTRDKSTVREKLVTGISALVGILLCAATLFTVMHWPGGGNGLLWLTAIAIAVFVLIPVYFFTGIRNPESRLNTIVTSIVLFGASGLLFSMINLRPSLRVVQVKMDAYIQSEDVLNKIQHKAAFGPAGNAVNELCGKIKKMIIHNEIERDDIPKDYEKQGVYMEEHNLGASFFDNGAGANLMGQLKTAMEQFNEGISNPAVKIPLDHSILNVEASKLGLYSNYTVLNSINQLQLYVAENGLSGE